MIIYNPNFNISLSLPYRSFVFLALLCCLSACQNMGYQGHSLSRKPLPKLPQLSEFSLAGKASFVEASPQRGAKNKSKKILSGNLFWQQADGAYKISLTGPLNQGHLSIEGNQDFATIVDSTGNRVEGQYPEKMLAELTGIHIPLHFLTPWVTGRTLTSQSLTALETQALEDGTQVLSAFKQAGWEITYDKWRNWNGLWLPSKVTAARENQMVKIFIHQWSNLSRSTENQQSQ